MSQTPDGHGIEYEFQAGEIAQKTSTMQNFEIFLHQKSRLLYFRAISDVVMYIVHTISKQVKKCTRNKSMSNQAFVQVDHFYDEIE